MNRTLVSCCSALVRRAWVLVGCAGANGVEPTAARRRAPEPAEEVAPTTAPEPTAEPTAEPT